ncbi:MAG: oxygen-independent coproporphyrinogen III oxidase [Ferruginibacter sp.]
MIIEKELLLKYNVPVPRYTSYPTVPYWDETIDNSNWKANVSKQFIAHNSEGISLYIHLPFCEKLCTYCGCNKKITTNHSVEDEYIDAVLKEWTLYKSMMNGVPVIKELHLGGGTPTFFSSQNLFRLITGILNNCTVHPKHEFSFEGHPNNTTFEHLQTLYDLGFRRVSFGVQDNDPEVQRIINRIQPIENVIAVTEAARKIGYRSINFDLIYGLPKQTISSIEKTILQCCEIKPDRIAFYSYAHVPWTSRGQRLFDENDLPSAPEKISLYLLGKKILLEHGYEDVGMDHFALPNDDLNIARKEGTLNRNFMGYTTSNNSMLIGLGVSAISDTGNAFAQNSKTLSDYYRAIAKNEMATRKGYFLSDEDVRFRRYILDISCNFKTVFDPKDLPLLMKYSFPMLSVLEEDGLVCWNYEDAELTSKGVHFLRNICSAFDIKLLQSGASSVLKFSQAI